MSAVSIVFRCGMYSTPFLHFKPKISHLLQRACSLRRRYSSSPVELAYKIHGRDVTKSDIPLIILHGLLGSKKNWESVSKALAGATGRSVVAVDLRNHGESPHSDSHTYRDLVADVAALMAKLSIGKAVLMGHSMGGRTAMLLSLLEPERVASLIVVDITPVPSSRALASNFFPALLGSMKNITFESVGSVTEARELAKRGLEKALDNKETINFVVLNLGKNPDKRIVWKINIDSLKAFYRSDIASFPSDVTGKKYLGPTLFIGGKESDFIPVKDLPAIEGFFPGAKVQFIDGAGHNVHADRPREFLDMVLKFLKQESDKIK